MAYDSTREVVVLYGGSSGSELSDMWEYDGSRWSLVSSFAQPGARAGHSLVYDASRQALVLYGGDGTYPYSGAVWSTGR